MSINYYNIGGHVCVMRGVPPFRQYEPFRCEAATDVLFDLTLCESLSLSGEVLKVENTPNGEIAVYRGDTAETHWQFDIRDIEGASVCLLQTSADFSLCRMAVQGTKAQRKFGINNAIMLVYALAGSRRDTLLIHASVVQQGDKAYAFTAPSGTGKSTQVSMWLRAIEGCELLNDDNPIVRVEADGTWIYGSPWSGKTPCYRARRAGAGAIIKIVRAHANIIEPVSVVNGLTMLLSACSLVRWDSELFAYSLASIKKVLERVPVFNLHCLPNEDAARVAQRGLVSGDYGLA